MNYQLLTGHQLAAELTFLPEDIQKNISASKAWAMIGTEEGRDDIITFGVFQKMAEKGAIELSYIYTQPDDREEGCALGLLNAAGEIFLQNGIEKIVCMPMGTREELTEFTHFLLLCEFEAVLLDGHISVYDKGQLADSKTMAPYLAKIQKAYTHLSDREMRYYARTMDKQLPARFRAELMGDCDAKKSIFITKQDKIEAGILIGSADEKQDRDTLLDVYLNPAWSHKQEIMFMLASVIKDLSDDSEGVNITVDDENYRKLYTYIFGEPETDCWVQRYEKVLKPIEE